MAKVSIHERRILKAARALAETGRHNGWFHIAHDLKAGGAPLALSVLEREPVRSELDQRCAEVRQRVFGSSGRSGPAS